MRSFEDKALFRVNTEIYRWGDVLLGARIWGDWSHLEAELCFGYACLVHVETLDDPIDQAALSDAARALRQQKNLTSAMETRAWTARHGGNPRDLLTALHAQHLKKRFEPMRDTLLQEYPPDEDSLEPRLLLDLAITPHLERLVQALASRAALQAQRLPHPATEPVPHPLSHLETDPETDPVTDPVPHSLSHSLSHPLSHPLTEPVRHPVAQAGTAVDDLPHTLEMPEARAAFPPLWPLHRDPQKARRRLQALQRLEAARGALLEDLKLSPQLAQVLRNHLLDWISISCQTVFLHDRDAAQEACLCVRAAELTLDELAAEAEATVCHYQGFILHQEPWLQAALVGAQAGELLGPLRVGAGFAVLLVTERTLPDASQPAVREAVARHLLTNLERTEMAKRITWLQSKTP